MSSGDLIEKLREVFEAYETYLITDTEFNAAMRVLLAQYFYSD